VGFILTLRYRHRKEADVDLAELMNSIKKREVDFLISCLRQTFNYKYELILHNEVRYVILNIINLKQMIFYLKYS